MYYIDFTMNSVLQNCFKLFFLQHNIKYYNLINILLYMYRHDKINYKFEHNIALNLIIVNQDSLIEDLNNVTYY